MESRHNKATKLISAIIALVMIFSLTSVIACADNNNSQSEVKTIRLGYFSFQNYMLGADENSEKSGYAYDLLCAIAAINNWKYEFVYGDFNVLYEEMMKGNIDILPCLVYTEERTQKHLFCDEEIYKEEYYISVLNENASEVKDISDLNGKRLSTVSDTYQNVVFESWAKENGITMKFVTTDSFDESWNLLKEGKADFILNIDSAALDSGFTSLFKVGYGSSKFAIAPNRKDIRDEMNEAIKTIYEINPFTIAHLKEKYLSASLSSYKLSEEEKEWISDKKLIRLAGFENDVPYTYTDNDGNVKGVYCDAVNEIFKKCGVDIETEWILFSSESEMSKALSEGKVDLICPTYFNHYLAQANNTIISEKMQDITMGLLYSDKISERDIKTIAVPTEALTYHYVDENMPSVEFVVCENLSKCIDAVLSGKADAAIAHISALQDEYVKHVKNFKIKTLAVGCPICFATRQENGILICIINRGLHLITDYDLLSFEINHSSDKDYAFWNYVKNNKLLVGLILLAVFLIILYAADKKIASLKLKKNLNEITKQKEIIEANEEKLIEAKEAANAANKAKSTFLFNMSHDIRTPMNAILGYSDRMLRHIDDTTVVKDSAGKIKSSGEYLLSLINDVLDMARIESDKVTIDEEISDIKEKAQILCDIFEVNTQKKDQTFISDFSGLKDTVVWYDTLKLRQIILNLISNAVKYTPVGGTITFSMNQTESELTGYGKYEITISDTGVGMSQEYIEHIFEQFSRNDNSITKETQGTGLGMSIVGKLIEMMGGTINIRSEVGKGTEMKVVLDLRIATQDEINQMVSENNQDISTDILKGNRILIVDDNELNREILQELLFDEGCSYVETAENGEAALKKAETSPPGSFDLILMDVQMPVMDGYEATRRIRALDNKEISNIPIIAMTANAFDEDRQDALAAGMNAHLAKPIDIKKLKETLAKYV